MDFKKYKYFYINGCSFTEGGGLEEESISKKSVIHLYKDLHGVEWKNRSEVNYGKRLEQIIGIRCINEAKCGSGTQRVVRTTYDFIYENWDDRYNFFIILEKPDSGRSEIFYKLKNDYYIVNSIIRKDEFVFDRATREYYTKKHEEDLKNQVVFKKWFENHYSFEERSLEDEKLFVGLYSFCKLNNIKIFVIQPNDLIFKNCFGNDDVIKFSDLDDNGSIEKFVSKYEMKITNELNGLAYDGHPGYFGHIEYAKRLSKFLGWKGEYPDFPEYIKLKNTEKKFI